jgi:hypothetical protein
MAGKALPLRLGSRGALGLAKLALELPFAAVLLCFRNGRPERPVTALKIGK